MPTGFGRRRAPAPPRGYARILQRLADYFPEEHRAAVLRDLSQLGRLLELQVGDMQEETYLGKPAPHTHLDNDDGGPFLHGDRHLPDGSDPITTAAPSGTQFGDPAAEGSANSLARSDHQHNRPASVEVKSAEDLDQRSLQDDIYWLAARNPWVNIYAHTSFR